MVEAYTSKRSDHIGPSPLTASAELAAAGFSGKPHTGPLAAAPTREPPARIRETGEHHPWTDSHSRDLTITFLQRAVY